VGCMCSKAGRVCWLNVVDPRALRSVREHCTLAAKGRKVQSYNEMRFGPRKIGEGEKRGGGLQGGR